MVAMERHGQLKTLRRQSVSSVIRCCEGVDCEEVDVRTREEEELKRASGGFGSCRGGGAFHGDGESRSKPGGESGLLMGYTVFSEGSRRHVDGHVQ